MTNAIDQAFADLRKALGLDFPCGSITLNVNDGRLQSVKTETYQRIVPVTKAVDKRERLSA